MMKDLSSLDTKYGNVSSYLRKACWGAFMNKAVTIMDVTLRDGSYAVGYRFTPADTAAIVSALHKAGVQYIELGHGCGLGACENLRIAAAASDVEYVKAARMAAPDAVIGVIAGPAPTTFPRDIDAIINDVNFIRFAANSNNPAPVEMNVRYAKDRKPDLKVFFQMMRSTRCSLKQLLESARTVSLWGVDCIYLVDTAGHFLPEEVQEAVFLLKSELGVEIGFHGHNNMSLAVANSLAAIEAGATFVDGSLKGLGRSAGNAMLEALVSLLSRKGLVKGIDFDAIVRAGKELVAPLMPPQRGISAIDFLTADANIDLYPEERFRSAAASRNVDYVTFMRALASDPEVVEAGDNDIARALHALTSPENTKESFENLKLQHEPLDSVRKSGPEVLIALNLNSVSMDCPDEYIDLIERRFPELHFSRSQYSGTSMEHMDEAEVLFSFSITPALVRRAPKLRWFHSAIIGAERYGFPELIERGITVTTPRGAYSQPMAESALGLMISHARKIGESIRHQTEGRWRRDEIFGSFPPSGELSGSTVLIVGFGGIGSLLGRYCANLGMKVGAVTRAAKARPAFVETLVTFQELDSLLPEADFIVLTCPFTPLTKNLIDAQRLALMKKTACLVNVARGGIVDESALLNALHEGAIGGAAFDVFATEPLPDGHPLFSAPRTIITPHCAGWSNRFWERCTGRFIENLERYLSSQPLSGEVDFERGY